MGSDTHAAPVKEGRNSGPGASRAGTNNEEPTPYPPWPRYAGPIGTSAVAISAFCLSAVALGQAGVGVDHRHHRDADGGVDLVRIVDPQLISQRLRELVVGLDPQGLVAAWRVRDDDVPGVLIALEGEHPPSPAPVPAAAE